MAHSNPFTYTLEIDLATGDFSAPILASGDIPSDPVSSGDILVIHVTVPVIDIGGTGDYAWRVVAIDGDGNSADSAVSPFTLADDFTKPRAPILRQPASGDTVDAFASKQGSVTTFSASPTFIWERVTRDVDGFEERFQGVDGVRSYVLQVDFATGDFTNPFRSGDKFDDPIVSGDELVIVFDNLNRLWVRATSSGEWWP